MTDSTLRQLQDSRRRLVELVHDGLDKRGEATHIWAADLIAEYSDLLTARERERVAQAIHDIRPGFPRDKEFLAFDAGLERAERIVRYFKEFEADPSDKRFRA